MICEDICGLPPAEVDAVVMFHDVPHRAGWFWKLLKPGFGHVQTWVLTLQGWVQIDGCLEVLCVNTYERAPWELAKAEYNPTFVGVQRSVESGRIREPFHIGPITCVDLAKAALGIRAPLVRTPYQLYRYLRREQ